MTAVVRADGYAVHLGTGVLQDLPAILRDAAPAHRYVVIADHHVAELHGAALRDVLAGAGLDAMTVEFPAGEWNKTREHWAELTDRMLAAGVGRDAVVVAFGGGVAGDLGGFVAATYQRGIPVVQVPTSLLAMIDASIGGKTGVDVPAGKNLVGAFHPPLAVVADIGLLATLPRPHLAAGLAEAVKHGVVADADYFASLADPSPLLARDLKALESVVIRSVEIKAAIVARDAREAGERQVLNFGHTVGHAVEAGVGFGLLHGEAVAVGMAVEARLAEHLGVAAPGTAGRIVTALEACDLPVAVPEEVTTDALLEFMRADKKNRAGDVRLALPAEIGRMARAADGAWTQVAGEEVLRQALDSGR